MIALYRAGRQADALAAYQDARSALDELGLEPSGELRSLEQRILRQDASLDAPVTPGGATSGVPARTCLGPDRPGARARGRVGAARPARHPPRNPHWAWWNGQDAPRAGTGTGARRRWTRRLRRSLVRERRRARAAHDRTRARRGRGARRGPRRDGGRRPRRAAAPARAGQLRAGPRRGSRRGSAPRPRRGVEGARDEQGPVAHLGGARVPRSPLPVPELGADSLSEVESSAAARLYVERARRSLPDFDVTEANAAAVARICRALDGLPLALELAAARVRSLGADGTAARLGDRLGLLSRGARDLPERQRSLRAAIDWSVQLLDEQARSVLAAQAAFSGGATLDAIEVVVGSRGRRPHCARRPAGRGARLQGGRPGRRGALHDARDGARVCDRGTHLVGHRA